MLGRHSQEKAELEEELAATCRDRDDSLMFAENEKQQVRVLVVTTLTDLLSILMAVWR